ncbi:MAG: hypothetical protein B7Y39_11040 [Bdellovibrio sp. 28-41-41]|nr:MAG: hypothetical protein B7Y39_11040 [Bdellovibrio sp. 28-41-41]
MQGSAAWIVFLLLRYSLDILLLVIIKVTLFLMVIALLGFAEEAHVAMALSKPPYIFEEDASGLECDIIRESFKAVRIDFKPSFVPMNRAEALFKSGQVNGVINKLENSLDGFPSDPYIDYYNVVASLKNRKLKIKTIDDLANLRVAGFQTAKSVLGDKFNSVMTKNTKYTEVAEQLTQVEQLLRKRVDAIVGDILIIKYYQRNLKEDAGLDAEIAIHDLFPSTAYRIMFKTAKMRDSFNKGLKIIHKKKIYSGIISRYTSIKK